MTELKHAKTFRYELGHVWFKAVTVADLIEHLKQYPADMAVLASWEGTVHSLAHPEVTEFEGEQALMFNVEVDVRD